jgi:hypothetical protein
VSRDPRVDAYIARAQPFARPILQHVRERVHALVPEIEEALKWGFPNFMLSGKILANMAAFKAHASVGFWRGQELGIRHKDEAMGQLGRLTTVADLPGNFDDLVREAVRLTREVPAARKPKHAPKPPPQMDPEFAAALDRSAKAKAAFETFPPGQRREYLEWIAEAKRDETRAKRIATAVEWIGEGKKRNWKYENC